MMREIRGIVFLLLLQESCLVCLSLHSWMPVPVLPSNEPPWVPREGSGSAAAFQESFGVPAYPSHLLEYVRNSRVLALYQLSFRNLIFLREVTNPGIEIPESQSTKVSITPCWGRDKLLPSKG